MIADRGYLTSAGRIREGKSHDDRVCAVLPSISADIHVVSDYLMVSCISLDLVRVRLHGMT